MNGGNAELGISAKVALSNVSFELGAGEPVGLVGPNGAGKTTLLSILSGFLRPTSGTVRLFGQPPGATQLIGKVSALPQVARLDPGFTIIEQLVFYARLQGFPTPQAALEAGRVLEEVSLTEVTHEKPSALSHGMAKRIAIAQALIGKPALILLDEPTAGLDHVNVRTVRAIIAERSPATTFIISSHDLAELDRLCKHILLLENGILQPETIGLNEEQSGKEAVKGPGSIVFFCVLDLFEPGTVPRSPYPTGGIENGLHGSLDVPFDAFRMRRIPAQPGVFRLDRT